MPRVILARHGETEWSISGQHTGRSDIPLTPHGRDVMMQLAPTFISCDGSKMVDPRKISHILCSPRTRSRDTLEIMLGHLSPEERKHIVPVETVEDCREWDYGAYEGKKVSAVMMMKTSLPILTTELDTRDQREACKLGHLDRGDTR